jgi:tetratricopeptide (TPR) repeat protein
MVLPNETNAINDESVNSNRVPRSNQFGSLNPNLHPVLIIIGIVQVLLILYWVVPRAVSLYYQTRGGQIVDRVLSGGEKTQWDSIACASREAVSTPGNLEILTQAVSDLNQAVRFSPNDAHPQLLLGRANCLLGKPEAAIKAYQAYVQLRPLNPLGQLELGFAYEAACQAEMKRIQVEPTGRQEQRRCEILAYQESMVGAWKAAGVTLQDFIDTGETANENGRIEDALSWFRRGSEFSPASGAPWFYIGKLYASQDEQSISTDAYLASFELGYTESINALVEIYTSIGDDNSLVGILSQALERFPGHQDRAQWWNLLGKEYLEQMDWETAIQVYEQGIVEFPENPQLHVYLGQAYYDGGKGVEVAIGEVERAIEINPDLGIGYYTLARIMAREKRYAEADIWYERALEKIPAENWWRLARANTARISGNYSLAEQEYLKIIERSRTFVSAYYELAWLYRLLDIQGKAIESIEQAIALTSTPKQEYYIRAGEIYEWAGDNEKALEAYRQALSLNPDNTVAKSKIEALTGEDK